MLKIRLQRTGRKSEPTFRIVVTESQNSTKSGKTLETVGSYDPRKSGEKIDAERVKYWISKGAKATDTMHNLLVAHKVIDGKKVNVLPRKSPIVADSNTAVADKTAASAEPAEVSTAAEGETMIETPGETKDETAAAEEPATE